MVRPDSQNQSGNGRNKTVRICNFANFHPQTLAGEPTTSAYNLEASTLGWIPFSTLDI